MSLEPKIAGTHDDSSVMHDSNMNPQSVEQNEKEEKVPAHVLEFAGLIKAHNEAVQRKNKKEKKKLARDISNFVSDRNLSEAQILDLQIFLMQQRAGEAITYENSRVHKSIAGVLYFPGQVMKLIAASIPPLCQETFNLAVSAVGLSGVGIAKGVQKTIQAARAAFWGHTAA